MAGTIDNPTTLNAALNSSRVIPGDLLWLRGGVYNGDFTCPLVGTAEAPIVLRAYPGERPIINGGIIVTGQYCHFVDLEIMWDGWTHRNDATLDETDGDPGRERQHNMDVRGVGNRVIGCRVHDGFNTGCWQTNVEGGFIDSLIYNIGAIVMANGVPGGQGHCLYTQNEFTYKRHHNLIMWGAYNYGFHAYTSGGLVNNFDAQKIISYNNAARQFASGGLGGQRARYSSFADVYTYPGGGDYFKGSVNTFTDCYWGGRGLIVQETSADNTFTNTIACIEGVDMPAEPTSGKVIKVFPREYQNYFPGWAHIAVYNFDQDASVTVDVSGVTNLAVGDSYCLHNAQDYDNDTVTGTVPANQTISVDMRAMSHSVIGRNGDSVNTIATSFPKFGAFVLEKL